MSVAKKKVTIILEGPKLDVSFEGNWTGKDLRVVMSNIQRKYRLYVRDLRRNSLREPEKKPEPKVNTAWGKKISGTSGVDISKPILKEVKK